MDTGIEVIDAQPVIDPASMTDDQILALTQSIRIKAIRHLTGKAIQTGGLPGDIEDRDALKHHLDGLEKVALSRKKIAVDQQTNAGMAAAAGMIAGVLRQTSQYYGTPVSNENVVPPTLGDEIPDPDLVPGETEVDTPQLEYNSFVASVKAA